VSPRRSVIAALVIAGVIAADAWTKNLVLDHVAPAERVHVLGPLSIVRRRNLGGAFSLAAGKTVFPWFVTLLVLVMVTWFVRALRRGDAAVRGGSLYAVSAMVGGALGNQVDRWLRAPGLNRGAVVDFLDVGFWPVFNVADSSLVLEPDMSQT
jgi:signal peptidase II